MSRPVKEWLVLCCLVICILFSVFVLAQQNIPNQAHPAIPESWKFQTISKISQVATADGGYAGFSPEAPELYSTFYFVQCQKKMHREDTPDEKTAKWLSSVEHNLLEQPGNHSLKEFYYYILSAKELQVPYQNRALLINDVLAFQSADGSFFDSPGTQGTILDTYRGIDALDQLGYPPASLPETKTWLLMTWTKNTSESEGYLLVSDTALLITALEKYDVTSRDLATLGTRIGHTRNSPVFLNAVPRTVHDKIDLFTLNNVLQLQSYLGMIDKATRTNVKEYLTSVSLPDGGYNALGLNYSEPQGTYLALDTASIAGISLDEDAVNGFISRHKSQYGGFYPAYMLQSTPMDTYFAVRALHLLDEEPKDPIQLRQYLDAASHMNLSAADRYYVDRTYRELGLSPPDDPQVQQYYLKQLTLISGMPAQSVDLQELSQLIQVVNGTPIPAPLTFAIGEKIHNLQNPDGGFGSDGSDTRDTFYSLAILESLGQSPREIQKCISWIEQGRSKNGGYVFRHGSNSTGFSYVIPTYYSVMSLEMLHNTTMDRPTQEMLVQCRSPDGGLRYAADTRNGSINRETFDASLEYTVFGLEVIRALKPQNGQ